jgi:Zn-dependent oligopeptidase
MRRCRSRARRRSRRTSPTCSSCRGSQQTSTSRASKSEPVHIAHLQSDTQKQIATQQAASASQAAFSQALLAASQSYSANVSAIMSNPDLKEASRQSALNAAAAQRDADYNMIQRVYGVSLGGSGLPGPARGQTG